MNKMLNGEPLRTKWGIVDVNKARSTCKEYDYNFKELMV